METCSAEKNICRHYYEDSHVKQNEYTILKINFNIFKLTNQYKTS